MRPASALLLAVSAALAASCTSILGTFELAGSGGTTATGTGGATSTASTGTTSTGDAGPCVPEDLASLCTGKICSDSVVDGCGTSRRCGSCVTWSWVPHTTDLAQDLRLGGLAVDASGVATVTGRCAGPLDFGDGTAAPCGASAIAVARVGPGSGSHLISRHVWPSPYPAAGYTVALRPTTGQIVFGGKSYSAVDFGQGPMPALTNDQGNTFLVTSGTDLAPTQSRGATDGSDNMVSAVAVAPSGELYVTGGFLASLSFTGCNAVSTKAFPYDGFLAKLDANLGCQWLKSAGSLGEDYVAGVAVAPDGNVVIAGRIGEATTDLLGCTGSQPAGSYVAKISPTAQCMWVKSMPAADAPISSVAVTPAGRVVVVGGFDGDLQLDATHTLHSASNVPTQAQGGEHTYDAFAAVLDANGTVLAAKAFGDELFQLATSVAAAPDGDVVVTGRFWGTIDLGGRPFGNSNPDPHEIGPNANSYCGGFVARFDAGLGHRWSVGFTQQGVIVRPNAVAVGASGAVVVAGDYGGIYDFGNGVTQTAGYSAFTVALDP